MHNMNLVKMLEFEQRGDERGHLVIAEGEKDIPFEIKRVFYIYGSDRSVVRGQHANRRSEFVMINVAGKSKVRVKDGEGNEAIYCLNRPHTGIYLPTMVWKDMYDFSEDSVLLILASTHYDPTEYIRDYEEYVRLIHEKDSEGGQA
jgi:dTDP-4-dehydrorhamnose 3,5-epimerase-like enzyme